MSKAKYEHIHIYERLNATSPIFRCTIPGCPHSISRNLLVNRYAQCPKCGQKILITKDHIERTAIKCIGACKIAAELDIQVPAYAKLPTDPFQNLLKRAKEKNIQ